MVQDHSSLSNLDDFSTLKAHNDLHVSFSDQVISGTAKVTLVARRDKVQAIWLDTRDLSISSVSRDGHPLKHYLDEPHEALGSRLNVQLSGPVKQGDEVTLLIKFATSPQSTALQWLQPAQTAGKKFPYLFSQAQAIHARSFVPCQDSPSVKSTYTASVAVPEDLKALMSANLESEHGETHADQPGYKTFKFRQDVPIPSYLLAIAVGHLESRTLGPRSKVWSEPEIVESAAYEFADTSEFLEAGEDIAGPYVWGNYDILLLPPSFPYGGMENPCLTFATPTLLAGDRSLVNVVAHEIAHSWTGNLVSNETWQDFWLNEGWTVFMERRILGRLKGDATEQFHASQGLMALQESVDHFGADHPFTQLIPDLSGGVDPDDSFSKVPYERGFYFLTYLQNLVGGKAAFEEFMKAYLKEFAFKTINSQQFKDFFLTYFRNKAEVQEIDWQLWYYGRGMPPSIVSYDLQLAKAAYGLSNTWHTADVMGRGGANPKAASSDQIAGWSSEQVVAFLVNLSQLRSLQPLHPSTTRKMNELYHLDDSKNAEIRAAWYQLCINAGDATAIPLAVQFLKSQGRMKYLRPLYRALLKREKQVALNTFREARSGYHPIAAKMVAADLGLSSPQ